MGSIYSSIDLLVISSLTEGIPLVVLEAMHQGIPVVSTRVGGIPEVVEDGIDGILVELGDPHALARAIESLILDDNKYAEISKNALVKIRGKFNQSAWIKKTEQIYHNVLR
jgi:glycosyltransferase involved in cell wall biosynthesis